MSCTMVMKYLDQSKTLGMETCFKEMKTEDGLWTIDRFDCFYFDQHSIDVLFLKLNSSQYVFFELSENKVNVELLW